MFIFFLYRKVLSYKLEICMFKVDLVHGWNTFLMQKVMNRFIKFSKYQLPEWGSQSKSSKQLFHKMTKEQTYDLWT